MTGLRALGVEPRCTGMWLMVGKPTRAAGWKLHISLTVAGVDALFDQVLPYLVRRGAHFKIASGRDVIVQLGAGNFGDVQIGKVVTVYPGDDTEAVALSHHLIEHTRCIVGPRIATDLHLGGAIYTRYGAIRPRISYDRFGEALELIPDGSGNWVPDLRPVPFVCPRGIANPFRPAAPEESSARPRKRALLGGRYFVTDVLRPGIAGSVLRSIDVRRLGSPVACVLKQARPHCSADEFGRDRRTRLRHEAAMLTRLRGLTGITGVGEYFEENEVGYLPVEYVPGVSLGELVYQLVTGRSWQRVRVQSRQRLLGYAAQLVRRLRAAHARGVIHRDVAPGNVWIGADERVYLIDWECAHIERSRKPAFRLGTPGFSDASRGLAPTRRDDWHSVARVLAFMLTGLDPLAVVHGSARELTARLAELTELRESELIGLLARALADSSSDEISAAPLLHALGAAARSRAPPRRHPAAPLFTATLPDSVLAAGLEVITAQLRRRLERLRKRSAVTDAAALDAQSGIAGLLFVLVAAHGARVSELHGGLAERVVRVLTTRTTLEPNLPGLMHGSAGRALAVAAAMHNRCVAINDSLYAYVDGALGGRLDWPDVTHGAAGQGFAALACAERLRSPRLASSATACADYLIRTQNPDGGWTLPKGCAASGERYTGFAHGVAGIMGFLGRYAKHAHDDAAHAAWCRAEAWLVSRAQRGRGDRWRWPRSDSDPAAAYRWCHGAPGIALGWLCVARAQGTDVIDEEHLRRALGATPPKLRSDGFGQCHGLAGVGEVYLEAHAVLKQECWRERAADIANLLVAMFRKRSRQPWHYLSEEPDEGADGLMLGTAGILHFLLRHLHPSTVASPPLLR